VTAKYAVSKRTTNQKPTLEMKAKINMQNVQKGKLTATFATMSKRPAGVSWLRTTIFAIVLGTIVSLTPVAFAQSDQAKPHCVGVGGGFVTNFITPDQTAGTATGDLKGALGVKLLGVISGSIGSGKPVVLKVQHFWVTESGDTLLTRDAEVTAYPGTSPSQPLLYSFVYEHGVELTGGTGKYEGATGLIKAWGGIDLGAGQVAGRYAGTICFKAPGK
jgi:hypothetical protein